MSGRENIREFARESKFSISEVDNIALSYAYVLKHFFINSGMLKNPKQDIEPSCGVFGPTFSRQSIYVVYKTHNLAYILL